MKSRIHRWWDPWATLLLLSALMATTARLLTTNWTTQLAQIILAALLAFWLGLALGFSRSKPFTVVFYGISYGTIVVTWLLTAIDSSSLLFRERFLSLVERVNEAFVLFWGNQDVHDLILFILFLLVVFWILGITSSYNLVRYGSLWPSILPMGAVLLIINHYDATNRSGNLFIGIYLFLAILYIGRITFLRRRRDWQSANIHLSTEAAGNISRVVVTVGFLLLFLSWLLPVVARQDTALSPAMRSIESTWIRIRERLSGAFEGVEGGENGEVVLYSETMALGTRARGGESVLFVVEPMLKAPQVLRNYWVVRYYDEYLDGQWQTTLDERVDIQAGQYLPVYPEWDDRSIMKYVVNTSIPGQASLIGPQYTFWVGRYVQAFTGLAQSPSRDIGYVRTVPPLLIGEAYEVRAWLNSPTQLILRQTSTEYPDWVRTKYLELPPEMDPRINQLAEEIAGEEVTPFDISLNITQYLRTHIEYQKEIESPPDDMDPIVWFLFDSQIGYCNYYASAEVILLRALGIPARMSVGYSEGTYLADKGYYEVRGENSHAWPEVYFPGWGWVPFEPTTSQPEIVLPVGQEELSNNENSLVNEPVDAGNQRFRGPLEFVEGEEGVGEVFVPEDTRLPWWVWVASIGGGILFLVIVWILVLSRIHFDKLIGRIQQWLEKVGAPVPRQLERWRSWLAMTPIERAYYTLDWALVAVHQEKNLAETPMEKLRRYKKYHSATTRQASELVDLFQIHQFSPRDADIRRAKRLAWQIRYAVIRKRIRIFLGLELRDDAYR